MATFNQENQKVENQLNFYDVKEELDDLMKGETLLFMLEVFNHVAKTINEQYKEVDVKAVIRTTDSFPG